ncbi:MAG TPA: diacylglycerol kinase [Saprospiraceae bacterium]|nr:diacylglycerol kinase [Saprospiraceae bacterium]
MFIGFNTTGLIADMRNRFLGTGEAGYHPLRKLKVILSGFRFAVLHDFSVTYKVALSVVILAVAFMLRQWVDFMMILTATGLVLVAELFNSAIEAVCDFVETKENDKIRAIKDIAAAAVGISIFVWIIVLLTETPHLGTLLW